MGKEGGHPCDPFCMDGKCEEQCKDADCNECDLKGDCKEPSKCPTFCTENCIPCAECHMEVEKMQKADEKKKMKKKAKKGGKKGGKGKKGDKKGGKGEDKKKGDDDKKGGKGDDKKDGKDMDKKKMEKKVFAMIQGDKDDMKKDMMGGKKEK